MELDGSCCAGGGGAVVVGGEAGVTRGGAGGGGTGAGLVEAGLVVAVVAGRGGAGEDAGGGGFAVVTTGDGTVARATGDGAVRRATGELGAGRCGEGETGFRGAVVSGEATGRRTPVRPKAGPAARRSRARMRVHSDPIKRTLRLDRDGRPDVCSYMPEMSSGESAIRRASEAFRRSV
jgi:hypothetical protein